MCVVLSVSVCLALRDTHTSFNIRIAYSNIATSAQLDNIVIYLCSGFLLVGTKIGMSVVVVRLVGWFVFCV